MLENLKLGDGYDGFLFLAESVRNPPKLNSHHHRELELNLVIRGSVTYVISGRRHTFEKRTLLWLFPMQEHQLVDRSDDAEYYVAVFTPEMIRHSCKSKKYAELHRKRLTGERVLHSILDPISFDLIRKTMESVMQGSLDPDLLNREAGFGIGSTFSFRHGDPEGLNAGLHYLLLLCWRCQNNGESKGRDVTLHPAVIKALQILGESDPPEDLEQLACRCGVSGAYLSRIFGKQIGVSLSRYRNSLRLSRFWEHRCGQTNRTLLESMYAAGFGSYAQFFKVFTQAYGEGPRECLRGANSVAESLKDQSRTQKKPVRRPNNPVISDR